MAHRDDEPTAEPVVPEGESETLLAATPASPQAPVPVPATRGIRTPAGRPPKRPLLERVADGRSAPYLRLLAYYVGLVALLVVLCFASETIRDALIGATLLPAREGGLAESGAELASRGAQLAMDTALHRGLISLIAIAGVMTLVVPVAWVYMLTKRFRYDPALVASVIILPIVVTGTALVVKNSLALAFSLAGVVAAVRFRNTLKDPRDAVYIFLVIACGLSAGVQALDVALAVSMAFNLVVLTVWKFNLGSIYGGRFGRTGVLSVGDPDLLVAEDPVSQRAVRRRMLEHGDDMRTDGILLVHSAEPDRARTTVQEALADLAREWRLAEVVPRGEGMFTLEYLVRMKDEAQPVDLVGALDERWSQQVAAAEYFPFLTRRRKRKKRKKKDG